MMATPANGPIEIVFCFDTTGSMSSVIGTVKDRVTELTERLLADIPAIRIGILAHGDYGDEPFLLQRLDLTNDGDQLRQFISNVRDTSGFDGPECYELALHEVRTNFSWSPDARKRLVIIGDDEPHDIKSSRNKRKIDWRKETTLLRDELHMVIYSVQAEPDSSCEWFWKSLADMSGGKHLLLSDFASIFDFLMAICYLEHGVEFFEAFEEEVRLRNAGALSGDVSRMLNRLGGGGGGDGGDGGSSAAAVPVVPPAGAAMATTASAPARRVTRSTGARRSAGDARLRSTKCARPMKAKRASDSDAAKRLRRAVTLSSRPKRESEAFSGSAIAVQGRWSGWQVLASPEAPNVAAGWRQFGVGFLRQRITVPSTLAGGDKARVLVELAVSRDDVGTSATPLYSRILCDSATNAVASVLRGNAVLKWRLHRAVSHGRRVLLRFAQIESEGRSLRQQRLQLRKSNSYAWNSGRVVVGSGGGARDLLSMPAPRARQLGKFVRSLAVEERRQKA